MEPLEGGGLPMTIRRAEGRGGAEGPGASEREAGRKATHREPGQLQPGPRKGAGRSPPPGASVPQALTLRALWLPPRSLRCRCGSKTACRRTLSSR